MSYMCFNPDFDNEQKCIKSNKIYSYGKTLEDCQEYCSNNKDFMKPYLIKPREIGINNDIIAIYKPPYMSVAVGNNTISKENMMHTIIINKLIIMFENIKENTDIKNELIIFLDNLIKISKYIVNIYNKCDKVTSVDDRYKILNDKLINMYNYYFSNKIDFSKYDNNIFTIYYIIIITLLNKFNKNIDINKYSEHNNLDFLIYFFNCITNNTNDIDIDAEYAPYNFLDPNKKIGRRSIMYWIINNHILNKYPITKDCDKSYGICNRLDINTSGIVICALNDNSYMDIIEQISHHKNIKIYTALLNGHLTSKKIITNTINKKILKHKLGFEYNVLDKKNINNHITIIYPHIIYQDSNNNFYTLVFIRILSGIHHQIRLHCSSIGHTVVSDEVYNCIDGKLDIINQNLSICPRLFLHSTNYVLKLNNIDYNFYCNLPNDLYECIDKLNTVSIITPKGYKINDNYKINYNNYNMNVKRFLDYLNKYKYFVYVDKKKRNK